MQFTSLISLLALAAGITAAPIDQPLEGSTTTPTPSTSGKPFTIHPICLFVCKGMVNEPRPTEYHLQPVNPAIARDLEARTEYYLQPIEPTRAIARDLQARSTEYYLQLIAPSRAIARDVQARPTEYHVQPIDPERAVARDLQAKCDCSEWHRDD